MEAESAGLKAQIDTLKGSIRQEEDKGRALLDRAGKKSGMQEQEMTLDELNRKVAEVYRAIFSEAVRRVASPHQPLLTDPSSPTPPPPNPHPPHHPSQPLPMPYPSLRPGRITRSGLFRC